MTRVSHQVKAQQKADSNAVSMLRTESSLALKAGSITCIGGQEIILCIPIVALYY